MKVLPSSKAWLAGWWVIWSAILAQQLLLHSWRSLRLGDNPAFSRPLLILFLSPLAASVALRWLVLPRSKLPSSAFVVSLSGTILAAMTGLCASFVELPYRDIIFLVCLAEIVAFAPLRTGAREGHEGK